jgi:hypothetical protein
MFSEAFYPEVKTPAHQHKGQHSDMYISLNYTTQLKLGKIVRMVAIFKMSAKTHQNFSATISTKIDI